VIGGLAGTVIDWYGSRRRRQLEGIWRDPAGVQERALLRLTAAARDTEFGLGHGFGGIRSVAEYQARVPVRDYGELRRWLERAAAGEESVAWPGRCRDWVKTSGTTAGDKMIPVTPEAFAAHKKGGWDALLRAASLAGGGQTLMGGPMLFLGGSTRRSPLGEGTQVGDLSGLVASRLPWGFRGRYSPGPACAAIPDWEERLDAIAALASTQDIRLLSGMPSWLVILFERVARHAEAGGRRAGSLGQLWPHLRVLIHGGVAFAPYADVFEEWLGRRLARVEVYPASEGFVGVQTESEGGLTLMLDYGIFYEFVPVEDLGTEAPRRHTVAEVELGRPLRGGDEHAGRPLVVRARGHGAVHRAGSAAARDHRAYASLRERLRRERHRRGGGARAGARLPADGGRGGGVHGGAALSQRGGAAGRARVAGRVPGSSDRAG